MFATTRSVTDPARTAPVSHIFSLLPAALANDLDVRHVILVIVFSTAATAADAHTRFLELGCTGLDANPSRPTRMNPVTPGELVGVLASPFIHTHSCVVTYARSFVGFDEEWISAILQETAVRCLRLSGKGKMLERLTRKRSGLKDALSRILSQHKLEITKLPLGEDKAQFVAPLSRPAIHSPSILDPESVRYMRYFNYVPRST